MSPVYDIVIIGGGINGCGIARDAAGRGLKVLLAEQSDLGSATSSASTKLIHGGLRYLEHYEFRLVRHALTERERLWRIAPHIIWPLRFVLPYRKGLRPAWLLRLGLFLYDHIGGRKLLPTSQTLRLAGSAIGAPLRDDISFGFEYSDCWVQDNRLVVLNARDAADRGADIRVRTQCVEARRVGALWEVDLLDRASNEISTITTRVLVNAAGPWADRVVKSVLGPSARAAVRLVQGSHIVVPRLAAHDRCYIFQNADARIFFAIPYESDFTLIGTTDRDYKGTLDKIGASEEEIIYLCASVSDYFKVPVRREDVVWSYSGVRPLYDDGATAAQEATRDYVLKLEGEAGQAPLLSIFGGKITTYRCLAEDVLAKLTSAFPEFARHAGWTGTQSLPGGNFPMDGASDLGELLVKTYPFLTMPAAERLVRHYGTLSFTILGSARTATDLGQDFGGGLSAAEVAYLIRSEFARTAEDVVWRRTKSGLHMSAEQIGTLDKWMAEAMQRQPDSINSLNMEETQMATLPLIAITGASSGIGEAVAKAFSAAGHPVLLMARRLERMQALNLPNSLCCKVDVRDRQSIIAAVEQAEALYGPVDMMFCNAGIARLGDIGKQDPDEWDEMIDINVKGVMNSVHAVMAGMMQRRHGTLFMMSSIAGRKVYPDHTVYCGTKYFVHGISESIREYLSAYDVRVVVLSPGIIETEVLDHVTDLNTLAAYRANKMAIGGGVGPEHVADLMLATYRMPQTVLVQEICITPTRQKY
eukprot:gene10653-10724_t